MSKELNVTNNAVFDSQQTSDNEVQVSSVYPVAQPWQSFTMPFFHFSYSCTEISGSAETTHIRSSHTRFENGKLTSQQFEGSLDPEMYHHFAQRTQQEFLQQLSYFMNPFSMFLPFR